MAAFSKFASKARTHEQARGVICCVCGKKVGAGGVKCVSERLAKLVHQHVNSSFSIHNPAHPTAMCGTCRVTLCAWEKVKIVHHHIKIRYSHTFSESSNINQKVAPIFELS